jgi:hypothetical protein
VQQQQAEQMTARVLTMLGFHDDGEWSMAHHHRDLIA